MAYQVIARKFRPQSFKEFVGQQHVTQTLINAMSSGRFPHAVLLTGPRGTGKTTTARIIAKTLLCQTPVDNNPCNKCQNCLDVTEGRHLDVIEIDGASNNGVDHIRELRDTVGYMPSSGKYKVYIIDEVHMLSTSAFNALLKTLEEPPEHVVFIFATTEVQKIPATILSRTQRFDFRNHTLNDLKKHLQNICTQEGIEFDDSALWVIAKQAKGSIRDSLTLLDQIISFSNKKLSLESVMSILGLTDRQLLLSTLKAIAAKDSGLLYESVNHFKSSGHDPMIFAEEFLELLRNTLMIKMECHKQGTIDIPDNEIEDIEKLTEHFSQEDIHLLFDVSLHGIQRMSYSRDPSLGLEMLLFKLLSAPRLGQSLSMPVAPSTSAPVAKTAAKPQAQSQPAQQAKTQATQKPAVASDLTTEITAPAQNTAPAQPAAANQPKPAPQQENSAGVASAPVPNPTNEVGKTWREFVVAVKQANGFLGALLEHTSMFKEDDKTITLGLPDKMSFLLDKLQEPKNIERTESFLVNYWQDKRKIEVELLTKEAVKENLSPKAIEENVKKEKAQQEADSIEAHPLVQAAEKAFQGNMTKSNVIAQPSAPK
ncbi:MAG: DNA polymerase III subunit gamma/tau [Bdellovibrionales bacterium]|nr:DNA polymerase III subunit gamma/tau [Bdellovibrionales bacterium]NQZ17718.1 DNA polymerase III subunit gamma/tau [Bdellovibrionales bacterium]